MLRICRLFSMLVCRLVFLALFFVSYLGFLNSIVPSGVVSWYVKSLSRSSSALFLSVVPSTIHSPVFPASRCKYFCVVLSVLCPTSCLTISAFCVLRSCLVM